MSGRKNLIGLSILLLIFNLILGGLAIFNQINLNHKISQANNDKEQVFGVTSVPIFNPNYIISDQTFSSTRSFPNVESVQNYLDSVNSPLKNYSVQGRRASYWIFAAARGQTSSKWGIVPNLNPGLLLAYLEKEQSLMSRSNYDVYKDPEKRIKTAMGYGCPDYSVCNSKYYGLVNQLNWAAYQLQYNFNLSKSSTPDSYKVSRTITTLDGYNVFLTNSATAAQYRYTPHVYWGNYNLWKIIVANGWGVNTTTYRYADIDRANLKNKSSQAQTNKETVSYNEVKHLLTKDYALGQQGEDIRSIQIYLRQTGYFTYSYITGYYGTVTQTALNNYRKDNGIQKTNLNQSACQKLIQKQWKIGQTGEDVKKLQTCLKKSGHFTWPTITGYYGDMTKEALEKAKISSSPTNDQSCQSLKNRSWKLGQTGNLVTKLQRCMKQAGYYNWPQGITGTFGTYTQTQLQKWKGLPAKNYSCQALKKQTWVVGERSSRVKQLQHCLQKAGIFKHSDGATGYFGNVTKRALVAWRGYF